MKPAAVALLPLAFLLHACEAQDFTLARHGCTSCHQPGTDGLGPSLRRIADAYEAQEQLVRFLEGAAEPRVMPESFAGMRPMLEQTKALEASERERIAEAILRHAAP